MQNNKKIISVFLVLVLALIVLVFWGYKSFNDGEKFSNVKNYKDATYLIQGNEVTLKEGVSFETISPESSFAVETRYFGNEVNYDFDSDGREDTAFILTQDAGGSGLFYYLVVALNKPEGFVGSEAMFIGDRIAPQSTNINEKGFIVVNYADRKPGEPFTTQPSVGKSMYVKFDSNSMTLGEVIKDFEGDADSKKMSLGMKTWVWVRTELNDGSVVVPRNSDNFKLTFKENNNTFSASTDCNGVGGEYTLMTDGRILFDKMVSTLMYCEGSQEQIFRNYLENSSGYLFTSRGELVLTLKYDSGSVIFR